MFKIKKYKYKYKFPNKATKGECLNIGGYSFSI